MSFLVSNLVVHKEYIHPTNSLFTITFAVLLCHSTLHALVSILISLSFSPVSFPPTHICSFYHCLSFHLIYVHIYPSLFFHSSPSFYSFIFLFLIPSIFFYLIHPVRYFCPQIPFLFITFLPHPISRFHSLCCVSFPQSSIFPLMP